MAQNSKMTQVAKLVGTMTLPELAEFCAMFHISLPVQQLMEAVEGAGISLDDLIEPVMGTLTVNILKGKLKIQTIKIIRHLTFWGLKESKDFLDQFADGEWVKVPVAENVSKDEVLKTFAEVNSVLHPENTIQWQFVED